MQCNLQKAWISLSHPTASLSSLPLPIFQFLQQDKKLCDKSCFPVWGFYHLTGTENKFPSITKHNIFTDCRVTSLFKESKLTHKASL